MRTCLNLTIFLSCTILLSEGATAQGNSGTTGSLSEHIIALEQSALERWLVADPQGYLDLYAANGSYFDPNLDRRVDGKAALEALFEPMGSVDLSQTEPRFEMISPTVTHIGDVALLTFNLLTYRKPNPESDHVLAARWNTTEVYRRIDGRWKIVHSHWSYTNPGRPDRALND